MAIKHWADRLKRDALTVWLAARDPRVPVLAKLVAGLTAAYAFSPIDLIPDFIPVLGLLDDLLIVPAGVWLVLKLVPDQLIAQLRAEAERRSERPVSLAGLFIVVVIWGGLAWVAWRWLSAS